MGSILHPKLVFRSLRSDHSWVATGEIKTAACFFANRFFQPGNISNLLTISAIDRRQRAHLTEHFQNLRFFRRQNPNYGLLFPNQIFLPRNMGSRVFGYEEFEFPNDFFRRRTHPTYCHRRFRQIWLQNFTCQCTRGFLGTRNSFPVVVYQKKKYRRRSHQQTQYTGIFSHVYEGDFKTTVCFFANRVFQPGIMPRN